MNKKILLLLILILTLIIILTIKIYFNNTNNITIDTVNKNYLQETTNENTINNDNTCNIQNTTNNKLSPEEQKQVNYYINQIKNENNNYINQKILKQNNIYINYYIENNLVKGTLINNSNNIINYIIIQADCYNKNNNKIIGFLAHHLNDLKPREQWNFEIYMTQSIYLCKDIKINYNIKEDK